LSPRNGRGTTSRPIQPVAEIAEADASKAGSIRSSTMNDGGFSVLAEPLSLVGAFPYLPP